MDLYVLSKLVTVFLEDPLDSGAHILIASFKSSL